MSRLTVIPHILIIGSVLDTHKALRLTEALVAAAYIPRLPWISTDPAKILLCESKCEPRTDGAAWELWRDFRAAARDARACVALAPQQHFYDERAVWTQIGFVGALSKPLFIIGEPLTSVIGLPHAQVVTQDELVQALDSKLKKDSIKQTTLSDMAAKLGG